jgi:hypothetical protein
MKHYAVLAACTLVGVIAISLAVTIALVVNLSDEKFER